MKRSEINGIIRRAESFFNDMKFVLPPWASWSPGEWKGRYDSCSEIVENMLGWDITDFGSGEFTRRGLLLFTIRNGKPGSGHKTYAEKVMVVEEDQETPTHFHWNKMEDIINRGGGRLVMEIHASTDDEQLSTEPLKVVTDGVCRNIRSGEKVVLAPGESITLEPRVYHRFFGEAGAGAVLVGEVSMVNDDTSDNRFLEPVGRFPAIDEDEDPVHLLVSDYRNYL